MNLDAEDYISRADLETALETSDLGSLYRKIDKYAELYADRLINGDPKVKPYEIPDTVKECEFAIAEHLDTVITKDLTDTVQNYIYKGVKYEFFVCGDGLGGVSAEDTDFNIKV